MASPHEKLSQHNVNFFRQRKIALADATGVVRRQPDFDAVVDVEPFWMVIGFFGDDGDLRHEAKGLTEIQKLNVPI